ncbi:type II toxin-antitoxin system RelE/ParE family toxin [Erwinia tracheiphila]|uniref:RelE toxin protein n=1 Tax=Erwinia tracheiphila TaxID=65700 RepID=A0A0M2K6D1_9GAMM|nr:type II toxin-antitoxin system RelE/ParE family toxin [Erwinia tracheiphila]EOS96572.1 RelE-like toxin protein [Erwinia tracheiphila PSU-1]KKF34940.1 RelE toxin protein [Erwinia tracheiphila]UIA86608.1 type II toxin-antitoxin system RelE/ParE family toxin [Erwinia tracheiphila]UIA94961.1 type II toxin-antitoxin system RelE/ParE family toxin [Erwinia tracheiphila]
MFTVRFHEEAETELDELHPVIGAKMLKLLEKLEQNPQALREPHCKPIGNGLFELTTKGGDIARGLWVYQSGKRIFVLRIFIKKTPKTPRPEIDLAWRRLEDMQNEE